MQTEGTPLPLKKQEIKQEINIFESSKNALKKVRYAKILRYMITNTVENRDFSQSLIRGWKRE